MTSFQDDMHEIMNLALAIRRIVQRQEVRSPELQNLMHDIDTTADAAWCHADLARNASKEEAA